MEICLHLTEQQAFAAKLAPLTFERFGPLGRTYKTMLGMKKKNNEATLAYAIGMHSSGNLTSARDLYLNLLKLAPRDWRILRQLGTLECQMNNVTVGAQYLEKALKLNSRDLTTHNNYASALCNLKRFNEAIDIFTRALKIEKSAVLLFNRGTAFTKLDMHQAAHADFSQAIALKPDYVAAHNNRGICAKELNRLPEAISNYDQALTLDPTYADAYYNKSLAYLMLGDFAKGWPLYEWRWKRSDAETRFAYLGQTWDGNTNIAKKRILVYAEQGYGDFIQFCRFVPMLKDMGAEVILETPVKLIPLIRSLNPQCCIVTPRSTLPAIDYHCALMSLPFLLKTTVNTIPNKSQYLKVDTAQLDKWSLRLGPCHKPRIGIAWAGNPKHSNDRNRSIALREIATLFSDSYTFVSLQNSISTEDAETLTDTKIVYFGDEINDFSDTAALTQLMSLVISVDTSVAHLAGALGKPVWVLLPWVADWRWMLNGNDSPWYDNATLYRQNERGNWSEVLQKVRSDMNSYFNHSA